jgi:hypothetical protein
LAQISLLLYISSLNAMNYSPIALFVYKRPDHTRQTIEALMQCPEFNESSLYVFCDGAKRTEEREVVEQTRSVVRALVGDRAIITESADNQGLANSIIAGVTQLVNAFERVIVLEDDLVVSPGFLGFMNQALEHYKDEDRVMQVSGYMFPVPEFVDRTEAMFLPFTVSWGWATWRRAWRFFDPEATGWEVLKRDRQMRKRFNLNGSYDYYSMIERQFRGECDSWAIRWYWAIFRMQRVAVFPPISYVKNVGFDGSGSHGWRSGKFFTDKYNLSPLQSLHFPQVISVETCSILAIQKVVSRSNTLILGILRTIKGMINRLISKAS